jgi:hypothetical protein
MRRYVLFNDPLGFFVKLHDGELGYEPYYSKDINQAAIFDKESAELQQNDDRIVEVQVDIRLA